MEIRFHIPTRILFGSGSLSLLKGIIEEDFKDSRLLLVTDQGIVKSGAEYSFLKRSGDKGK